MRGCSRDHSLYGPQLRRSPGSHPCTGPTSTLDVAPAHTFPQCVNQAQCLLGPPPTPLCIHSPRGLPPPSLPTSAFRVTATHLWPPLLYSPPTSPPQGHQQTSEILLPWPLTLNPWPAFLLRGTSPPGAPTPPSHFWRQVPRTPIPAQPAQASSPSPKHLQPLDRPRDPADPEPLNSPSHVPSIAPYHPARGCSQSGRPSPHSHPPHTREPQPSPPERPSSPCPHHRCRVPSRGPGHCSSLPWASLPPYPTGQTAGFSLTSIKPRLYLLKTFPCMAPSVPKINPNVADRAQRAGLQHLLQPYQPLLELLRSPSPTTTVSHSRARLMLHPTPGCPSPRCYCLGLSSGVTSFRKPSWTLLSTPILAGDRRPASHTPHCTGPLCCIPQACVHHTGPGPG